jgi:membrane protein YqaA with SNARE-associated domain
MTSRIQMLLASQVITWLVHLGGPGLILLGIADSSVVPMPGSMDALTIWLAASNRDLWFYYAAMAVAGSVSGGYMTYALARKGGKEAFERKFSKKKANKVFRTSSAGASGR